MEYSLIIPVYNRPDEVDELLASLEVQTLKDFEVVVVEDGSTIPCQNVVNEHASRLALRYFQKENSGPGQSRNYGAERSQGEYLIVLDSDCVLPPGYLQAVDDELTCNPCDAFGGPDPFKLPFTLCLSSKDTFYKSSILLDFIQRFMSCNLLGFLL